MVHPGRRVEAGETTRAAAARELAEETGLLVAPTALTGPVWTRRHVLGELDLREVFYALRVSGHTVDPARWTDLERSQLIGHRWWAATELAAATDQRFAPRRIARLLPAVVAAVPRGAPGHWPGPPLEVGV